MDVLITVGLGVATVLGAIGVFRSKGTSEVAWAALIGFGVLFLGRLV